MNDQEFTMSLKMIKPTFESLLAATDTVYVRYEDLRGDHPGSRGKNGRRLAFPLPGTASLNDVAKGLEVVEYLTGEEGRRWPAGDCYPSLIRERCGKLTEAPP